MSSPTERYTTALKNWTTENPGAAAVCSLAGGFLLGVLGISRAIAAVQILRSVSKVSPEITRNIVNALPGNFGDLNFDDDASNDANVSQLKH